MTFALDDMAAILRAWVASGKSIHLPPARRPRTSGKAALPT